MSETSNILAAARQGEPQATELLWPRVYDELRKIAAAKLAQEKPGQTLQATALVHEAWMRMAGGGNKEPRTEEPKNQKGLEDGETEERTGRPHPSPLPEDEGTTQCWDSRGHFFAAAAEAMRRILVEAARRRQSEKRGGKLVRQEIDEIDVPLKQPPEEVLAVHEALDKLAATDSQAAELVKLRYFGGFTLKEAAEILGIAPRTADDVWSYARAWLAAEIQR